jgi:AAA domain
VTVAEPVVKAIGDSVWVIWKNANGTEPRAVLEFARVAEHRDSLSAEVSVHNGANTELHWARVNLVSTQARNALVKAVEEREPMDDWRTIIGRSCRLVAKHVRTGEPAVPLVAEPPRVEQWMVNGLIIRDQLNVLFGDGGTGKSYMALALGLSGLLRRPLSARRRMVPLKRVLYLDWESGRHEQAARLWRLTEGFQSAAIDGALMHRTMRRPLVDDIAAIRAEVSRHEVDFVVADSLAPACGPEPETAGAIVPALLALRSLAVTVLIIAHVSHQSASSKAPARPFGSVFVHNLARSTIEVRRSDPDTPDVGSYVLSLYHRKVNDGRSAPPSALQLTFGPSGAVKISGSQPDSGGASLGFQILDALSSGSKKSAALAEELDAAPNAIRAELSRLEKRNAVVRVGDPGTGRGRQSEWARLDTKRSTKAHQEEEDRALSDSGDDDLPF